MNPETPNQVLQRTRPSRRGCNPRVPRAGSLSAGGTADAGRVRVPLLAWPAVLPYGVVGTFHTLGSLRADRAPARAGGHCWASQQWHPARVGRPHRCVQGVAVKTPRSYRPTRVPSKRAVEICLVGKRPSSGGGWHCRRGPGSAAPRAAPVPTRRRRCARFCGHSRWRPTFCGADDKSARCCGSAHG